MLKRPCRYENVCEAPARHFAVVRLGVAQPPERADARQPRRILRGSLETGTGPLDIAIVRDISERRRLEKALLDQLAHDALTGLPNRGRILEMLAEAMGAARKSGQGLAVMVLDIDQFKKVNDGYGYSDGDAVLRECVARIGQELQSEDTLARQGGNEFILV